MITIFNPVTNQPLPPGKVPSLPSNGGLLIVDGIIPAKLALYAPDETAALLIVTAWEKHNTGEDGASTTLYAATINPATLRAHPTLEASMNDGPRFHILNGSTPNTAAITPLSEQIASAVIGILNTNLPSAVQETLAGTPPIVTDEVTGQRLKLTAKNKALKTSPAN